MRGTRRLCRRADRLEAGLFVAEGPRVVGAALDAGCGFETVLYAPDLLDAEGLTLAARAEAAARNSHQLSASALRAASDTVTPQGLMATVTLPRATVADAARAASESGLPLLFLDGWQDPGNLGSALRGALAAGVGAVATARGGADPFGNRAVRAGAGAHFRLTVAADVDWEELKEMQPAWLASPRGGRSPSGLDWRQCRVLVVPGETGGPSSGASESARETVTVPMSGAVESLNAACATTLLCYLAAGRLA
ncbi:MAG: TrmH family RNA methyltransferase [Candidatus Dormibacteria bacterium]